MSTMRATQAFFYEIWKPIGTRCALRISTVADEADVLELGVGRVSTLRLVGALPLIGAIIPRSIRIEQDRGWVDAREPLVRLVRSQRSVLVHELRQGLLVGDGGIDA